MFFVTRFLPFLNALIAGVAIEMSFRNPARYIEANNVGVLLLVIGTILLMYRATNAERLTIVGLVALFYLGAVFLTFFLSSGWIRHLVAGSVFAVVWLFLEEAYRYIYEPERYHRHALDHIGAFLGIAALAMTVAGLFGLRIFLVTRLFLLVPIAFAAGTLISALVLATHPMRLRDLSGASMLFGLLVAELMWCVSFLPSHYWVNATLVTVPYYVALHIVRHELGKSLTSRHLRRYSVVAIAAIVLVVSTAQWVI